MGEGIGVAYLRGWRLDVRVGLDLMSLLGGIRDVEIGPEDGEYVLSLMVGLVSYRYVVSLWEEGYCKLCA